VEPKDRIAYKRLYMVMGEVLGSKSGVRRVLCLPGTALEVLLHSVVSREVLKEVRPQHRCVYGFSTQGLDPDQLGSYLPPSSRWRSERISLRVVTYPDLLHLV
jgi:hypothetical protein